MMADLTKESYNKYEQFPLLPYNTTTYLIENNEMIWKLLKYNDADAWSKPNLTLPEKRSLIYKGDGDQDDYRVFFDTYQDDSWDKMACILRISTLGLNPINYVLGDVTMCFEVYTHAKINHLSNYVTRVDMIIQQLLQSLNGQDVGGLGRLYFDHKARVQGIGQFPFKGKVLTMCTDSV